MRLLQKTASLASLNISVSHNIAQAVDSSGPGAKKKVNFKQH